MVTYMVENIGTVLNPGIYTDHYNSVLYIKVLLVARLYNR